MFTPQGVDIALRAAPGAVGRFDFDWDTTGNPKFDNDRHHAVLTQLVSWRRGRPPGAVVDEGGYFWDEAGLRGSLLWTVKYDTSATGSSLTAYAEDALQVLVQENVIASFRTSATRLRLGQWRLDVTWTLPSGQTVPTLSLNV